MRCEALIPVAGGRVDVATIAAPRPRADEALVAVHAFSINRGETFLLERPPDGWRPGKDIAGVVVAPAADGSGPALGARVVGHPPSGGWSAHVAVPGDRLTELPDALSFTDAAALPLAGLTALRLTRATGSLASRRVLMTGAAGGVGHFFVQLAAAHGALVTAVVADAERGARLLGLGAARVVTDLAQADEHYDVAIDSVGGDATAQVWSRLVDDGLLVWLGQASRVAPTLDFFDWRGGFPATLRKFSYEDSAFSVGRDLATLVRLAAAGRLTCEVTTVADWTETNTVIDALLARRIRGNAVLTIPQPDEEARAA